MEAHFPLISLGDPMLSLQYKQLVASLCETKESEPSLGELFHHIGKDIDFFLS